MKTGILFLLVFCLATSGRLSDHSGSVAEAPKSGYAGIDPVSFQNDTEELVHVAEQQIQSNFPEWLFLSEDRLLAAAQRGYQGIQNNKEENWGERWQLWPSPSIGTLFQVGMNGECSVSVWVFVHGPLELARQIGYSARQKFKDLPDKAAIQAVNGKFVLSVELLTADPNASAEAALMHIQTEDHHVVHGILTRPSSSSEPSTVPQCGLWRMTEEYEFDFKQLAAPDWSMPIALIVRKSSGGDETVKIPLQKVLQKQFELFTKTGKGKTK